MATTKRKKPDDELQTMRVIIDRINRLEPAARARVVGYVAARYDSFGNDQWEQTQTDDLPLGQQHPQETNEA